jgi:hypothetical protein
MKSTQMIASGRPRHSERIELREHNDFDLVGREAAVFKEGLLGLTVRPNQGDLAILPTLLRAPTIRKVSIIEESAPQKFEHARTPQN